jgi:hypothetical protein
MASENTPDDCTDDFSLTGFTELWDGRYCAVPWPNNTYIIIETASVRAITLTENGLCLQDIEEGQDANNRWLCVEKNGYFAFYNPKSGVYMGHDGGNNMRASATALEDWELMTPRRHPDGGYQLLVPHWWHTMTIVTLTEDGKRLVKRPHAQTTWEFIKV